MKDKLAKIEAEMAELQEQGKAMFAQRQQLEAQMAQAEQRFQQLLGAKTALEELINEKDSADVSVRSSAVRGNEPRRKR
jgi:peptidoglycan hydrolase CwlO-like protein